MTSLTSESIAAKPLQATLRWHGVARLGLVQAALGAIVIFATSSLSRLMVVEYALPALLPGFLVALHYAVQMLRPRWGYGSDVGGRGTRWIIGGMTMLAVGNVGAATATTLMGTDRTLGIGLALVSYLMIGVGVGAAGTSLLVLLAKQTGERHRAAAATTVWIMMISGFIATAAFAGTMLDPFSPARLIEVAMAISSAALLVTILAVWRLERSSAPAAATRATTPAAGGFRHAVKEVWREPQGRRFTIFIFLSMLAYSAQELILEPFGGLVFALTPGASAKLAGLQHGGLLAGMLLVAAAGSLFAGRRLGAMRAWMIGGCAASALAVAALAATGLAGAPTAMRICVVLLGIANGAFSIAAIGLMMQLAASGGKGREGTRMGLWGAAQAIAFSFGGLVATAAVDIARHVFDAPVLAYAAVFLGEAALFCLAASVAAAVFRSPAVQQRDAGPEWQAMS